MANAHRIARECGITLHGRGSAHPSLYRLPHRHSWSRDAIKRVAVQGQQEGKPDHVYSVLSLLVARDNGACMLFGDVIKATSMWMLINEISEAEAGLLIEPFGKIDLTAFRQTVERHRILARPNQIALLISLAMEPALETLRNNQQTRYQHDKEKRPTHRFKGSSRPTAVKT